MLQFNLNNSFYYGKDYFWWKNLINFLMKIINYFLLTEEENIIDKTSRKYTIFKINDSKYM